MPNFSSMPNLERLNIEGCTSLRKLHSSIGAFPEMKFLKELLLNRIGIKELLSSIGCLTSLDILDVSWCLKFQKLPNSFANMRRLRKLICVGPISKNSLAALDIWNLLKLLTSHIAQI